MDPMKIAHRIAALATVVFLLCPALAQARLQRVEAVGNYGIRESERTRVIPRDQAVQKALWEGVSRVALEEMGEDALVGGEEEAETAALRSALGDDMLPFTRSFKILEDKGENPVLFQEDPQIKTEYVVVVEVLVDVDRVSNALASAGLVAGDRGVQGEPVAVEFLGIGRYRDFEALRQALQSDLRASRVDTLGFAQNRQLLSIRSRYGPRELAAAVERLEIGGTAMTLEAVEVDEIGRRVRFQRR